MIEIELAGALPTLSALHGQTGQRYQRARCIIRLHAQPLGTIELSFLNDTLEPDRYVEHIWEALHQQINDHLHSDDLPTISTLSAAGLPYSTAPTCIAAREEFFAHAPFVSIIVSTRDRPELLSLCLPALMSQHYPHYEIVIVDNAPSTDMTAYLIQQTYSNVPHLHYVREDRPGLSKGLNRGITEAKGEILAFTDDDVIVDSYWLLQLVRAFSLVDNVACVTGLVLP